MSLLCLICSVFVEISLSKLRWGSNNSCKCSNCNSCSSAMHNCNAGILIILLLVVLWMLWTLKEWWGSHQPACWPWKCMKNVWNTLIQWIQRHPHLLWIQIGWPFSNQQPIIQGKIWLYFLYLYTCTLLSTYLFHGWTGSYISGYCCWFSQLVQGNSGNMSAALQQIQARSPLTTVTTWTICSSFTFHFFLFPLTRPCWTFDIWVCRTSKARLTWVQIKKVCLWTLHQFMDKRFFSQNLD